MRTLARFLSRGLILLAILRTGPGPGPDRRGVSDRHRDRSEWRRRTGCNSHRDQPGDQRRVHRDFQRCGELQRDLAARGRIRRKGGALALQDGFDEADPDGGQTGRPARLQAGTWRPCRDGRSHQRDAGPADRVDDGWSGHLRDDPQQPAAQRPQHRPALVAAAGRRDAESEHVHRRSAISAAAALRERQPRADQQLHDRRRGHERVDRQPRGVPAEP